MSKFKVSLIESFGIFLLLLFGACSPALTIERRTEDQSKELKVLVPKDGQRIGEGDSLCPAAQKFCNKLRAEGRVPSGYAPFFGVEPIAVSPKIWIQPVIQGTRSDGTFSGLVYLGEEFNGAGEYFKIYVLACKDKERFHTGDVSMGAPKDCLMSEPVEVLRTR